MSIIYEGVRCSTICGCNLFSMCHRSGVEPIGNRLFRASAFRRTCLARPTGPTPTESNYFTTLHYNMLSGHPAPGGEPGKCSWSEDGHRPADSQNYFANNPLHHLITETHREAIKCVIINVFKNHFIIQHWYYYKAQSCFIYAYPSYPKILFIPLPQVTATSISNSAFPPIPPADRTGVRQRRSSPDTAIIDS